MARLIVHPAIKERLERLILRSPGENGTLDCLLEKMMDIYEERLACPRGAIR